MVTEYYTPPLQSLSVLYCTVLCEKENFGTRLMKWRTRTRTDIYTIAAGIDCLRFPPELRSILHFIPHPLESFGRKLAMRRTLTASFPPILFETGSLTKPSYSRSYEGTGLLVAAPSRVCTYT